MFTKVLALSLGLTAIATTAAYPLDTLIMGTVQPKCSIYTARQGVYGNPTPNVLSTDPADGGVVPRVRFDIAQADYYLAKVTWPNEFSSSPTLDDAVAWTGEATVTEITDPLMSDFETNKVEYNNVTEFDLDVAGTVWISVSSNVEYGYNKALPPGNYTAVVTAECIAK